MRKRVPLEECRSWNWAALRGGRLELPIDFEDSAGGGGAAAANDSPTAVDMNGFSGAGSMDQLTLPEAASADGRVCFVGGYGETGLEKIVAVLTKSFLAKISVESARAGLDDGDGSLAREVPQR